MIVLGIHDGHDASACLMRDGQLVLASAEERRCNEKNFAGTPRKSIRELFDRSGIAGSQVGLVAVGCRIRTTAPVREKKRVYSALHLAGSLGRYHWSTAAGQWLLAHASRRLDLHGFLESLGVSSKVITLDHHQSHAACAYYHRPWTEDTLVLTLDGGGDGLCASVWKGRGNDLSIIARTPKFHSVPGELYSNITAHLGLRPYEHEYKVMGMAPYGQAKYCIGELRDLFSVEGLEFRNRSGRSHSRMRDLLHKRLRGHRFDDVAAACQLCFEGLVIEWVKNAIAITGLHKVACCGGAFLNVKANKLIRELPEVEKVYVYPASDDGGSSEGAAILGYLQLCKERGITPKLDLCDDMYFGLEFSNDECLAALNGRPQLEYRKMNQPAEEIAELLASRCIVARFAGREEWGPRALGNRSILADPRDMGIIRKLNFAIKHRDFWMPFAASILEEDAARYMSGYDRSANGHSKNSPFYMVDAYDTNQPAGEEIVAGTHPFDKTVRPQVVDALNPGYRDIIRAFKRRTGVGAVLNTSFNLHGYPIVGSPETAVDTFLRSELDALVLGSYLVWKRDLKPVLFSGALAFLSVGF
jgi:carbamoyltransferase